MKTSSSSAGLRLLNLHPEVDFRIVYTNPSAIATRIPRQTPCRPTRGFIFSGRIGRLVEAFESKRSI